MLSSLKTRVKKIYISRVEIFLILLLLTFGIPMILLIPPGAGYDEEDHLVRVWELSAFSFIPGQLSAQELKYPTMFRDLAYRQQSVSGIMDVDFWQRYDEIPLYERGYVHRKINTKSVYSPALLFPQAISMRYLGHQANLPALTVFYLCRLAGLLSYVILVWLAMRLIPFGKWILLILAASPMALFQATTISTDAISNGIGFLFIGGCLRAAQFKEIGWRECGNLIFLIFLLFLAKLNLIPLVLLPFLLIPASKFTRMGIYAFLHATTVILFVVEVAGWNMLTSTRLDPLLANEANLTAQLLYIAGHPLIFLQTILKDLIINGLVYFRGWINGYGYYYWTPPQIVSLFFLLGLGSALLSGSAPDQVNKKSHMVFIFLFVAGYLATILSLYVSFTPVGLDEILGVQGRYFIPLALLLFLSISSLLGTKKIAASFPKWVVGFLALTLSLNIAGIILSFYVPCGTTFYQTGLCYQPLYKDFTNETRLSQPITNEVSLTQEIQVACNGLTELRFLLIPSVPENKGATRFILQDPLSNKILLDTSVMNDQIPAETWYPLNFDPDWDSAGKQYILEILSPNTSTGQGLRFLYSPQPELDLGNLSENGQAVQEDIVLQYGCITGLRKIWLTGRP
jgi:uncharacterized membrane protein